MNEKQDLNFETLSSNQGKANKLQQFFGEDTQSSHQIQYKQTEKGCMTLDEYQYGKNQSLRSSTKLQNELQNVWNHATHISDHSGNIERVRIKIALLGLTIAVVNSYAQATFCISIVEMVVPADLVSKNGSTIANADNESLMIMSNQQVSNTSTPNTFDDNSCPIEYKYRDYYDKWRFPNQNITASTDDKQQKSNTILIDLSNRFDWDASQQGLLLGAFAIGTAPLQIFGGRLAEIYGSKWVLFVGCIGTAITNLSIPFLAHFSFSLLLLNRIIMGVTQAGMEPGLMCLLAEWLTPIEVGFFISMLLFAICIGFFLGSLCSSFILALDYGWPLTYYVAGSMNLLVAIVWFFYADSWPSASRLISNDELKFIELAKLRANKDTDFSKHNDDGKFLEKASEEKEYRDLNQTKLITKLNVNEVTKMSSRMQHQANGNDDFTKLSSPSDAQAPWFNILTTPSVWAFVICKISIRWCADVLSIELPTYLANVLHLSIKLNGILNSISSALFAIFSFITGYLVNELLQKQQEPNSVSNKTTLRKSFQSIASFGSALSVFLMTQYDCNILFSMSMLLVLSCCLVMGTGGELQIPYDMTSKYPGTLHGMACTLSVSGWLAPPLIGLILGDQPSSRYRWGLVWYLTAFINLVGGLVFVLFADSSPRDFDIVRAKDGRAHEDDDEAKVEAYDEDCDDDDDDYDDDGHKEDDQYQTRASRKQRRMRKNLHNLEREDFEPMTKVNPGSELAMRFANRPFDYFGYHNEAYKLADSSPPLSRPMQPFGSDLNQQQTKKSAVQQPTINQSNFDCEPIRIRQVEASLLESNYSYNFEPIAKQTIIFPYTTTDDNKLSTTDYSNNIIWSIFKRITTTSRKQFSLENRVSNQQASAFAGLQPDGSSRKRKVPAGPQVDNGQSSIQKQQRTLSGRQMIPTTVFISSCELQKQKQQQQRQKFVSEATTMATKTITHL